MKAKSLQQASRSVVPFWLPVCTQRSWWQTLIVWLWQGWQRLRAPRLQIHPPLQPARHKPFPQRPHQQRRQAVFAALDAAPADLTRRQLIAHVRAVTGLGCSEKLITEWRAARRSAGATERQGDTATPRQGDARARFVQLRLWLLCVVLGATLKPGHFIAFGTTQEITISPAPSAEPDRSNLPSQISKAPAPRLLRIKLTINAARDLLVKPGDDIQAGQVLTNRSHERQRLLAQRRRLATQAQPIGAQLTTAAASLALLEQRGAALPPISFASEQAAITKAAAAAVVTTRQVEVQQQKLSVVRSQLSVASPSTSTVSINNEQPGQGQQRTTDDGQLTLIEQHETARLTFAQDAARQAVAEVALQKAKLTSAQEVRAFQEKQHALEVSQQWLTARHQQQQAVLARSQLLTQIAALDLQLAQLAEVRAPFAGQIRRIEYEDMHDQIITVVVYLFIGSR